MEFIARWLLLALWVVCVPMGALGQKLEKLEKKETPRP